MRSIPLLLFFALASLALSSCTVTGGVAPDKDGKPQLSGVSVSFNPLVLIDYFQLKQEQKERERLEKEAAEKAKRANTLDSGKIVSNVLP